MSEQQIELSDEGWALLRDLARPRVRPGSDGWIPHTAPYRPLVWLGLIEERPGAAHELELRLTDFGWSMLRGSDE